MEKYNELSTVEVKEIKIKVSFFREVEDVLLKLKSRINEIEYEDYWFEYAMLCMEFSNLEAIYSEDIKKSEKFLSKVTNALNPKNKKDAIINKIDAIVSALNSLY